MGKGEETKTAILAEAMAMASVRGLQGLSIGVLAERTGLSKSGLFGHFRSKESLQRGVLEAAIESFVAQVIQPALGEPRGEARLTAVFEKWLRWDSSESLPGGCPLITASIELDDQPGPLRDFLAEQQTRWSDFIAKTAHGAVEAGEFRPDLDLRQFAFEFTAIGLGHNYSMRLLRDPQALNYAREAFKALLSRARI